MQRICILYEINQGEEEGIYLYIYKNATDAKVCGSRAKKMEKNNDAIYSDVSVSLRLNAYI